MTVGKNTSHCPQPTAVDSRKRGGIWDMRTLLLRILEKNDMREEEEEGEDMTECMVRGLTHHAFFYNKPDGYYAFALHQ